jgi:cyclophilin family peptidyl-prolyl cis-trans isomerase
MSQIVRSSQRHPRRPVASRPAAVENLETRTLFATAPAHVTSIVTDNRGEVQITFDKALDPATIKTTSVQEFVPGPDGLVGTADDQKIIIRVRLNVGNRRIWIRTADVVPFAAGSTYWIKINSTRAKDAEGNRIDGEFNGPGVTGGNGTAGGDLLFVSKRDKSLTPTARFSTVLGNLDVALDTVNTPKNAANFLTYANGGAYDFTYLHRSVVTPTPFIIQGGGFRASLLDDTSNGLTETPTNPPIQNEFHTSNTRGTIAFAKIPAEDQFGNPIPGGGPDSATDQWFFNLGDNSSNLDNQNGGFTVFGNVKNAGGLAVMDALAGLTVKDLSAITNSNPSVGGNMTTAPVVNPSATAANLHPLADLAIIRRIAVLNKVVAFA